MSIPEEIKRVPRPKSTVVKYAFGRYLVIKRTSKRVPGKKTPRVVDLGTIGEIKDGKYIEIRELPKKKENKKAIDIKDYGTFAVAHQVGESLYRDLKEVFREKDADKLYAMALLRSIDIDIKNRDIQMSYQTSYLSEVLPNIVLSENTIATFLKETGMEYSLIRKFLLERSKKFTGKKQIIDGTLKDNNSIENDFSEFSRKGRIKGSKDISLLYSFDLESKEPVLMKVYSGNMIDKRGILDFIKTFALNNSILVMDKGFNSKANLIAFKKIDNLTFILPLNRKDKMLYINDMYEGISHPLLNKEITILCKSKKVSEDTFIYSFRDPKIASEEEIAYTKKHQDNGDFFNETYEKDKKEFGVISFITNKELSFEEVYEAYTSRWEIEIMFNMMKDIIDLDTVNVHNDYSIIASEFINYLAVIISQRIKKLFKETKLVENKATSKSILQTYSYKQVMKFLSKIKKIKIDSNWETNYPSNCKYIQELGEKLGV